MNRTTIDFGMDLGTTNSGIAVMKGTEAEVIRNNENFEYTPSAVWVDRKGRLQVGRRAKEQYEFEPDNGAIEFKLRMGSAQEWTFPRYGQRLKSEDLSAEVLKSLLGDVRQRLGEDVAAAVITVPAAFDLPSCDATRKAAQVAGLSFSPLVQEPVAAALAYGFQSTSDRVYWLVYDLGGGTFDAALIKLQDGMFRVVNCGGDNQLGGKYIDWEIIDQVLAPAAVREHHLADFRRGDKNWCAAFAKLKIETEKAKIRLSREESAEVAVEFADARGQIVQFEYELQRREVEQLIEPFLERSINICKKVLADKRLGPGDVQKVLLVGGPTLTPRLRQRLADRQDGLGIALDFSQDPMTVVARGAAIFAGTQRQEGTAKPHAAPGQFALQLEYNPVGAETDPMIMGRVMGPAALNLTGYTVEFSDADAKPPWRSGKVRVAANGTFGTELRAERGRSHTFLIELRDANGRKCDTVPDRLAYTVGNVPTDPPLIHTLGVAMANNEMDTLVPKGTSLPVRKKAVHRTAFAVARGHTGDLIRIPLVEGENADRADRNRLIGRLEVAAEKLKRDVLAGSEIEITIDIDQSRLVRTKAYIPILDEEYEAVARLGKDTPTIEDLRAGYDRQTSRLGAAREKAATIGDSKAHDTLRRIDRENTVRDVETSLAAADGDPDAAERCKNRLLDLTTIIDEVEDALEWPALVAEAEDRIKAMLDAAKESQIGGDRDQAATLERETRQAMKTQDADLLRRKVKEVVGLTLRMLWEQPGFLVSLFRHLVEQRASLRNPTQADQLIQQGNRAMLNNDIPALRSAVQQLLSLLPAEQQQRLVGFGGTTIR